MQPDLSELKVKADAGDSDAAFAIFKAFEESKTDTAKAWDLARHYLMLATEKENPDALLAMGRLLVSGTKLDKDVERGMARLLLWLTWTRSPQGSISFARLERMGNWKSHGL